MKTDLSISDDVLQVLSKEAKKRGLSVSGLMKELLGQYAAGELELPDLENVKTETKIARLKAEQQAISKHLKRLEEQRKDALILELAQSMNRNSGTGFTEAIEKRNEIYAELQKAGEYPSAEEFTRAVKERLNMLGKQPVVYCGTCGSQKYRAKDGIGTWTCPRCDHRR